MGSSMLLAAPLQASYPFSIMSQRRNVNVNRRISNKVRVPDPYTLGRGAVHVTVDERAWRILGDYWYQYEYPQQLPGTEAPDFRDHRIPHYLSNNLVFQRCIDHRMKWARSSLLASVPNLRVVSAATNRQMPRFLYRVSHSESGGSSAQGHFKAQALIGGLGRGDISNYTRVDVLQSLALHVKGAKSSRGDSFHSPWISFTSSLLFCKFWAFKNQAEGCSDVRIHIVDTHDIKRPALIVHAYSMLKAYKFGAKILPGDTELPRAIYQQRLGSSYAEYLVWNELFIDSDSLSLAEIEGAEWGPDGKPTAYPPLRDLFREGHLQRNRSEVFKLAPPSKIRHKLYRHETRVDWSMNNVVWDKFWGPRFTRKSQIVSDERKPLNPMVFEAFTRIAKSVKAKFQLKMLVGMLAIRTRYIYRDDIIEAIAKRCKAGDLPYEPEYYGTGLCTPVIIEVQQQQQMMVECARQLGMNILLGDDRPKRNLVILDCAGPSGHATTYDALGANAPVWVEAEVEEEEGVDEEVDDQLKALHTGPEPLL